jgi:hypothetical protein
LDLDVLFWTLLVMLPRLGKFNPPEGLLFQGPFTRFVSRYLSWFIVDAFVSLAAISLSGLFFRLYAPLDIGWMRAVVIAVVYSFLFSLTCAILKVNRITWSEASGEDILSLVPATFLATLLAAVINAWLPNPEQVGQPFIPFGMVFLASLLAFLGFVLVRFRKRITIGLEARWLSRWSQIPIARERGLVVGGGESGQIANNLLSMSSYGNRFHIIGYVDDDLYKQGTLIRGIEVLGKTADIPHLVQKYDIGLIFFAIHNINAHERSQLLDICLKTPARTVLFPDLPAALNSLIFSGKNTDTQAVKEVVSVDHETNEPSLQLTSSGLPCHLCLIKHSPIEIDTWLQKLEKTTCSGNLEAVSRQIAAKRETLQPDIQKQFLANRHSSPVAQVTRE